MIGEVFEFNGKSYSIKRDVSFGEYKKISKLSNSLQRLSKDFETASDEDKIKILDQFSKTTEDQLQAMGDFLESMLGLTQIDIDVMSLTDAISLFNESFTTSTQVKKKLEKTSNLQSSSITPNSQN